MPITFIIIISAVIPIVLTVGIIGALMRGQAKTDQLLKTGMPARGRVVGLGTGGGSVAVMGHRHLRLTLTCEVQPQMGAPYVASFTQLISELQIASIQPGAFVDLRIDPANPMRIALAGVIPQNQPMQQQQGWGGPPAPHGQGYGQPGGFAAQPMAMNVATPQYKSALPMIIIMLFITTVPVTGILLWQFGAFDSFRGSSSKSNSDTKKDEPSNSSNTCAEATACCKVVSGAAGEGACDFKNMPEQGCKISLEQFKQSAKQMKKSCD